MIKLLVSHLADIWDSPGFAGVRRESPANSTQFWKRARIWLVSNSMNVVTVRF